MSNQIDNIVKQQLQVAYQEFSNKHIECVANIISNSPELEENKGISIVGLIDGFNSILAKQIGLSEDSFVQEEILCSKILDIIEQQEDKIKAMVIVSKLCTELLSKINVANEINKAV